MRIDAAGGTATVRGTLIADTLPPTYVNATVRRYVSLHLGEASSYGWREGLGAQDSAAVRSLLAQVEVHLLHMNDSSYDVFDRVCTNESGAALNLTNMSYLNGSWNGTTLNMSNSSDGNATSNVTLLLNLTNLSALSNVSAPNATNGTNGTASATDFCLSLINASYVNGSLVVHSIAYSPYCDPCLRARTITPVPLNHTAISLTSAVVDTSSLGNPSPACRWLV